MREEATSVEARNRALEHISRRAEERIAKTYGTERRAGAAAKLWRPYRGVSRLRAVRKSTKLFGLKLVSGNTISVEDWQALQVAAAFRGAVQGRGPGIDERACAQLAIREIDAQPEFTQHDREIIAEAFEGLAARGDETLSPLQQAFNDADVAPAILGRAPQQHLLRCIESLTTEAGITLPRTLAELGRLELDPARIDEFVAARKLHIADIRFLRPEADELIRLSNRRDTAVARLDALHRLFRENVERGSRPGTALVKSIDAADLADGVFGSSGWTLPSPEKLHVVQHIRFETHYGRPPREGEIEPPHEARRREPGRDLSSIDQVLEGQQPGSLPSDFDGEPASPIEPRDQDPPEVAGPAGGL